MTGSEVFQVLKANGVERLYHANTVTTSCTFLELGGLASRGCIEARGLHQTAQDSDDLDKRFGIWHDVFTDGVDIHQRGSLRNLYGPVLFMLPVNILLHLPAGTDVLVTRENPVHWRSHSNDDDRYFISRNDLLEGYRFGDFGKHVTFRNSSGLLPFVGSPVYAILDDPQRALSGGGDAYAYAFQRLQSAATAGGLTLLIGKRKCAPGCRCQSGWKSYDSIDIDSLF